MDKIIKLDDTKIEEYKFYQYTRLISMNDIDINKIVVSSKFPFGKQGFRYFIDYKDDKEFLHLCIFHPRISTCRRDFHKTKCMYFLMKDEKFLDKYN